MTRLRVGLPVFGVMLAAAAASGQVVFRSAIDLIALIGPERFEVTIEGRRRKVVSAQFIGQTAQSTDPRPSSLQGNATNASAPANDGRTIILAVDSGSFEPGTTAAPIEAARNFVSRLEPDDRLGLFVFSFSALEWAAPSTARAGISVRLSNLVGQKEAMRSHFNLTLHDVVDISAEAQSPFAFFLDRRLDPSNATEVSPVRRIARRECATEEDCAQLVYSEGLALAALLQRQSNLSLLGLETLLGLLSEVPGRKSVVLLTGGLLVSDRPDGRPDVGKVARAMGQSAARANATIYTVHVDQISANLGTASKKAADSNALARDRAMSAGWLEDFSRSAGGTQVNVPSGAGVDFAFNRVLRETSAYYLLGVEPATADRDGEPHELKVKVDRRGVTVRNRQWVVVPRTAAN
jgi:VWFA-related protein